MAEETFAMQPPAPAKAGFFGQKQPQMPDMSVITDQLNTMGARVKIGEERYSELRKKLLVVEQNMLSNHKKAMIEVKSLQSDVTEIRRAIQSIEDKMITIIKELRLTARKEEIDVMRKYIDLWDPVKFVSRDQVDKIIDDKFGRHVEDTKPNYDSPS